MMETIQVVIRAIQELSVISDMDGILKVVKMAARTISGADGVSIIIREDDFCHYVDEDAIQPLWKGQRFPLKSCISGWVILNRESVIIRDIYLDARIKQDTYKTTFVKSLAMVPVREHDPIGAIGVYWSEEHTPSPDELKLLENLAYSTSIAFERLTSLERYGVTLKKLETQGLEILASQTELIEAASRAQVNENSLLASELSLRRAQEIVHIGSWYLDLSTGEVTWTAELYKMYGFDPELPPPPYTEHMKLFTPESWEALSDSLARTSETGIPYELELRTVRKDRTKGWMWVRGETVTDPQGKIIGLWGAAQDISGRKLKEQELTDAKNSAEMNEGALLVAQKIGKIGSYLWDLQTNLWTSSLELDGIFGIDETYNRSLEGWVNIIHPDFQESMNEYVLDEVISKRQLFDKEYRIIRQDDQKPRWVHGRGELELGANNQPLKLIGTIQDITERREIEIILKQKSEIIETQNEELQQLNEELASTNEELTVAFHLALENEEVLQKNQEQIRLDNERLESLLRISQYQSESIQDLFDFALEEAIKLTNSKIGYIYFYDESTCLFTLNTWSSEVMKECSVLNRQTVYELDKTGCWGEAVRQRKSIMINEYKDPNPLKRGTPQGHVQLEKFLTIPLLYDGKIVAVAGVANKKTDYDHFDERQLRLLMDNVWKISERISLIDNLKIAKEKAEESDRLKSSFLANMSHEIRTPLNGIMGFSDLLKEEGIPAEERIRYLEIIEQSGERMLNTINDIIDIAKIESGQVKINLTKFNLHHILRELLLFFQLEAQQKGLQLSCEFARTEADLFLYTDRDKFFAVMINLIKNSIKYTIEGSIDFGYLKQEESLVFFVRDTGIGIPANLVEEVFQRFFQVDNKMKQARKGTGLGLAISKAFLDLLGGKIWLESEEGVGTTFYFSLPVNEQVG